MALPFSISDFLDAFGAFNTAWWPVVAALWLVTASVFVRLWRPGADGRLGLALLSVHWAWSGFVYHGVYFRPINPAATVFAMLFIAQAAFFLWCLKARRASFTLAHTPRGLVAGGFLLYGLAYPFIGLLTGLEYPRLPLFAVPCPTTLVTAGLLLASNGLPRAVNVVPILWAAIGSSAAVSLGIRADLALIAVVALLTLDAVAPKLLGARPAG